MIGALFGPPPSRVYPGENVEEDIFPTPAPKPGPVVTPSVTVVPHPDIYRPVSGEHYATPHDLAIDRERREALEEKQATEQLSIELGLKPASQQGALLSQPTALRTAPVAVSSFDFARQIAAALIGSWASVRQQEELASQLYRQKTAYVPPVVQRQVESSIRWDFVLWGGAAFAALGLAAYFLARNKKV